MLVKTNPTLIRVQFIAVNVMVIIIGVVAHFLAGAFLIPFLASLIVLNGFWYFMTFGRKRIVTLELNASDRQLQLTYQKAKERLSIDLNSLKLQLEEREDHNANRVVFLSIYQGDRLLHQFKPASWGFQIEPLEELVAEVKRLKSTTDERA